MAEDKIEHVTRLVLENWDAIGVEELDGALHLPASIKRRDKSGAIAEVKVLMRNVTNHHRFKARTHSREWAKNLHLDLDRDADLVEHLENYSILAFAIRDVPEGDDRSSVQHVPDGETLFKLYDQQSLSELWGRYDAWIRMLHPSFGEWDAEQMWQVIARIRGGADVTPLAVMPGIAQASCILLMAREACCSPNAPSWLRSSVTSTPAG